MMTFRQPPMFTIVRHGSFKIKALPITIAIKRNLHGGASSVTFVVYLERWSGHHQPITHTISIHLFHHRVIFSTPCLPAKHRSQPSTAFISRDFNAVRSYGLFWSWLRDRALPLSLQLTLATQLWISN